jgi:stage V sporulation protein SpoVS
MALSGTGNALGNKIAAIILHPNAPQEVRQNIIKEWQEIGTTIVNHIIENLEIERGISVGTGVPVTVIGATVQTGKAI